MNGKDPGTIFYDEFLNLDKAFVQDPLIKDDEGTFAELSFEKAREMLEKMETVRATTS